MTSIRAKGPQTCEVFSTELKKQLHEQTARADKLFTEVGEMKVELTEKDKEIELLRSSLGKAKKKCESLENSMAARQDSFSQEAQLAYTVISSSLLEVSAECSGISDDDQQISEEEFFDWLKVEMANLPNIIEAHSGYATRFTAEAVIGLMERSDCSDTSVLANSETD